MTKWNGLAIHGKRYCGKSFNTKRLQEEFPDLFNWKIAFADPAKKLFADHVGINVELLHNPNTKEFYRPDLISWCDEQRARDKHVFVKAFADTVAGRTGWICDDLRRPEELGAIIGAGGIACTILTTMEERIARGLKPNPTIDNHPTEIALDDHPYFKQLRLIVNGSAQTAAQEFRSLVSKWF